MPKFQKRHKKKTYRRRRTRAKKYFKPRRGLIQQIVPFTRVDQHSGEVRTWETHFSYILTSEVGTPGTNGNSLVKTLVFQMDNLPGTTDIQSLFKMYRLNAVKLTLIPASNNTLNFTTATARNNNALMIRTKPNRTGTMLTAADRVTDWNQNMAVKRFVIPFDKQSSIYMKVNQLSFTYRGNPIVPPGNYSYAVRKPAWVETTDLGLDHYGLDMRIDTVSGENISDIYPNIPAFTILTKYYFQCKGVK